MTSSKGLWLHHAVVKATKDPVKDAKVIANIGISRFGRMSYSFVVHPDGTILEGQNGHVGAHTKGQNSTSQAVVAVGNYETDKPTPEMLAAIRTLMAQFGPLLGGHRDAPGAATACPGRNLYAAIPSLKTPPSPVFEDARERIISPPPVPVFPKPSWVRQSDWDRLHRWRAGS
jgi:hypothetical protein